MKKVLQTSKPIIDVYNGYASIQSIVLNIKEGEKWVIQNYLNYITYYENNYDTVFMDYTNLGEICFSSTNSFQPQHLVTVPWKTLIISRELLEENIISFIKKCINKGYYIFVYLNYKYLLNEKMDFIHDIFIYGYDDEKKEIYMKGYNKQNYGEEVYKFEQVEKAFEGIRKLENVDFFSNFDVDSISLVKNDEKFYFEFSVDYFVKDLEYYLNKKKYTLNYKPTVLKNRNCNTSSVVFGNESIEVLKKYIENKNVNKEKIDIRQFYFLKNNKEGFNSKWIFLLKNNYLDYENLLLDWKIVENMAEVLLFYAMKYNVLLEKSYGNQDSIIKIMLKKLEEIKNIEKNIIEKIIVKLKK